MEQKNQTTLTFINVSEEELLKIKASIPILNLMNDKDPNFNKLVHLMKGMASLDYETSKRYELMYQVIKIGNLMEILLDKSILQSATGEIFQTCSGGKKISELKEAQQYSFFKIARNITADAFHQLYEDKAKDFLESFSSLCRGNNVYELFTEFRKYNHLVTKNAKKFFTDSFAGERRKEKIFCQMGYFLLKAEALFSQDNTDGAIMALIAAGSCGRDFNVSGLNINKKDAACFKLSEDRKRLSHSESNQYNEEKFVEFLKVALKNDNVLKRLVEIEKEALVNLKRKIDVQAYYKTKEKSGDAPESPRAYDRSIYKH